MNTLSSFSAVALALLTLSACQPSAQNQQEITQLRSQVEGLSAELTAVRADITALKAELASQQLIASFGKSALLRPSDEGYSTVPFDLGVLTVQLADVEPYANGSRVSLKFGNPLASDISGLKIKLRWGKRGEEGNPNATNNNREKEFTLTQIIRAGAWTTVPLVLDSIPPADLDFVVVSDATHTGVILNR
jgi:outer membrane murein-binding lipoprotein Lpp